jgi:orotidine-5'-phosphate decarboxylase
MSTLPFENKPASKSHVKMRGTLSDPPAADASEFPILMPGIRARSLSEVQHDVVNSRPALAIYADCKRLS